MSLLERVRDGLNRRNAFVQTFSGPSGDLVLRELAAYCGVLNAAPTDPEQIARFEGRRDVYLHLTALLSMTPADVRRIVENRTAQSGDPDDD